MKWLVTTKSTVVRTYEIEAADEKSARAATEWNTYYLPEPIGEEEMNAEVGSVQSRPTGSLTKAE